MKATNLRKLLHHRFIQKISADVASFAAKATIGEITATAPSAPTTDRERTFNECSVSPERHKKQRRLLATDFFSFHGCPGTNDAISGVDVSPEYMNIHPYAPVVQQDGVARDPKTHVQASVSTTTPRSRQENETQEPYSISYQMPESMSETEVLPSTAYTIVNPASEAECIICMNHLCEGDQPPAQLVCGQQFHVGCLREAAKRKKACPVCRKPFLQETPTGHMPSGRMTVSRDPSPICSGFAPGSIFIRYKFHRGIQQDYHPNPGKHYHGTVRTAYLPDSSEGRDLLCA